MQTYYSQQIAVICYCIRTLIVRGIQYVLSMMRKCIMVKVGGRKKRKRMKIALGKISQFCWKRGNMQYISLT